MVVFLFVLPFWGFIITRVKIAKYVPFGYIRSNKKF